MRWLFARFAASGDEGWAAPSHAELSEHFTDGYLSTVNPDALAKALGGAAVTDSRVQYPPVSQFGQVPGEASETVTDAVTELGLVGLGVVSDLDVDEGAAWGHFRGWADLETDRPLHREARFPAYAITKLITATMVLRLVGDDLLALDAPANTRLTALQLADDDVTVRELLTHTGGVHSPATMWGDHVAQPAELLGTVVGCSGERGRVAYGNGGYAVLGQLAHPAAGQTGAGGAEPAGHADGRRRRNRPRLVSAAGARRRGSSGLRTGLVDVAHHDRSVRPVECALHKPSDWG